MLSEKDLVLELEDVSRIVDNNLVIDDISWKIKKGEHWAMLGANGAGKTTLMKIISGYLWPTKGKVKVLGERFGKVDLRELRKNIGYVNSVLLNEIPWNDSVLKVVLSGRFGSIGLYEEPTKKNLGKAEDLLEFMGCLDLKKRQFGKLSQGEQQKVLIARALMSKPGILIMDEPAIGLDPAARERFLKRVEKTAIMEGGPTLIYITHHIEEIIPIFKKAIILKDGRILAKGRKERILTDSILEKAFDMRLKVIENDGRYVIS